MNNKILIIAGMHRSGTSLITQWLNKCGLQIGENTLEADTGNKDGHFEDLEFFKMHQEILSDHHLPADGLVDHNIDLRELTLYEEEKLKSILKIKNKLYTEWGWKDPRTCLLLDTYKELLPGAYYLVILRDFNAVVGSLLRRDIKIQDKKYTSRSWFTRFKWKNFKRRKWIKQHFKTNTERYLQSWIVYNERILKILKSLDHNFYLVVNYINMHQDDKQVFARLTEHWQFNLQYYSFNKVFKPDLIHENAEIENYILNKPLIQKARYLEGRLKSFM
jgi:hypothetical protein